jgi:hypothetical protein
MGAVQVVSLTGRQARVTRSSSLEITDLRWGSSWVRLENTRLRRFPGNAPPVNGDCSPQLRLTRELLSERLEIRTIGGEFDHVAKGVVVDSFELGSQALEFDFKSSHQKPSDGLVCRLDRSFTRPFRHRFVTDR